jgi:hypothetical protein
MKRILGVTCWIVLAACGKDADQGPDLKKMKPDEACAEVGKRMQVCSEQIATALGKAGIADGDLAAIRDALREPISCNEMPAGDLERIAGCYSTDCDKFSACVMPFFTEALRPSPPPR